MPFFVRKPPKRKLKENKKKTCNPLTKTPISSKNIENDHEIESETDDDVPDNDETYSDEEGAYLTTQEKKVKLAQMYLKAVEEEEKQKLDTTDDLSVLVEKRLKEDELERAGKLKKRVADTIVFDLDQKVILSCKQHKLSITCLKISWDNLHLFSSSKDRTIVKWCLKTFCKLSFLDFKASKKSNSNTQSQQHKDTINSLVISSDNKYLISGDEKGIINIWLTSNLEFVQTFQGHKKGVTDLAVCPSTNSLYSTSKDALVKVWNLNELGYMETLFGHQAAITSVDILKEDRVITSGGSDKTLRVWKIQEESQLVYNGHSSSIDIVRKLDEGFFISGGDDGCLCLWGALKKKPLCTECNVHGICSTNDQPNWITALAVIPNCDLIASGSCNGSVSLWKWSHGSKTFQSLRNIPIAGYINCLQFTSDVRFLIVGVGREHKLGRWQVMDNVKNSILCIPLIIKNI